MLVVLSVAVFIAGFGGGRGRLSLPLGRGDLLPAYATAMMWSDGTPSGNNRLGFPFGMDLRYYPTADVLQNAAAGMLNALTGSPFFGTNAVFAASFPATALAALWVLRMVGLRGPVAIFAALAFDCIPYHWLRIEHVYLGTMYSAVLGVGVAFLIGSGDLVRRLRAPRRLRFIFALMGILAVIATSGIYYACFTILLSVVALVYRFAYGSSWREIGVSLAPVVGVVVFLGAALAPAILFAHSHPPLVPVAERGVMESVSYSGVLALALLPVPISDIPGMGAVNSAISDIYTAGYAAKQSGVIWYADGGSFFTVVALVVAAVGFLVVARRRSAATGRGDSGSLPAGDEGAIGFGLIGLLLATVLLFFVPWGLNFLFAYAVTTQLRGWDRLIPVIFLLVFAAAAVAWRSIPWRVGRAWGAFLLILAMVLLVLDGVLPYRAFFDQAAVAGTSELAYGHAYRDALNAAIPGDCGVLEEPYVAYPEEPPLLALANYAPFLPALTNPEKSWSFGAMKGTTASAWQKELGNGIDAEAVTALAAGGFCAIHVDLRGYEANQGAKFTADLTALLGAPVAVGRDGAWLAFSLARIAPTGRAARWDMSGLSGRERLFYAPADVSPVGQSAPMRESDGSREWWWLGSGPAEFRIRSTSADAKFATVSGALIAAPCAGRDAVVTLTDGERAVSQGVHMSVGGTTPFLVSLPGLTDRATLTVESTGPTCSVAGDSRPLSVALSSPVARG